MSNWKNRLADLRGTWIFVALCLCLADHLQAQFADEQSTSSNTIGGIEGYEASFPALGTLVEIKVFSENADLVGRIVKAAENRAKAIEATLTDYNPDSEGSMLTERACGESFVSVSPDLWNVLAASDRWHKISDGAFDASLGSLTRQWRAERRTKQRVPADLRLKALEQSGWRHVQLNYTARSVRFTNAGVRLDFGAIGKGYVVDEIFKLFDEAGLKQCLVNISGNMRLGNPPPYRQGWRIEISPLEKGQPILRRLILANTSLATSGDLWQFTLIDGVRRSHIHDPRTGESVRGPIAATIITPSAADADACATAVCVLGPTAGAQLVQSLANTQALILEHSDASLPVRYIATEGFSKP
jgi:FAD:protein FMN transferase